MISRFGLLAIDSDISIHKQGNTVLEKLHKNGYNDRKAMRHR